MILKLERRFVLIIVVNGATALPYTFFEKKKLKKYDVYNFFLYIVLGLLSLFTFVIQYKETSTRSTNFHHQCYCQKVSDDDDDIVIFAPISLVGLVGSCRLLPPNCRPLIRLTGGDHKIVLRKA